LVDELWRYDYLDLAELPGAPTPRPLVPVSLRVPLADDDGPLASGLVDSGSEYTIAHWRLADDAGLDPTAPSDEIVLLRIGGSTVAVHLCHVELTLHHSPTAESGDEERRWYGDVGSVREWPAAGFSVVLDRRAFFDQWTVTFWGAARQFAIDPGA
jgi:hypothetical protein